METGSPVLAFFPNFRDKRAGLKIRRRVSATLAVNGNGRRNFKRGRKGERERDAVAVSSKVDVYRFRGEGRFTISGIRGSRYSTYPCFLLQRPPSSSRYIRLRKNNWPRSRRKVVATNSSACFSSPSLLLESRSPERRGNETIGGGILARDTGSDTEIIFRLIKVRGKRRCMFDWR